jgi:hypothetical protein
VEWSADCNGDGIVDYGQCRDGTLPDYNGNNIPDCCERGEECVLGNYPVQWRVTDGGNGHWYQSIVAGTFRDWNAADAGSKAVGATLATITNAAELDFVWRNMASNAACWKLDLNFGGPMLGGMEVNGQWQWVTGEPWDFTNWGPCYGENSEHRLHFGCASFSPEWNNLHDWETNVGGAIFEWSADCNHDGIVDYGQILQGQLGDANSDGIPDICQQPTCRDADLFRDLNVNGADLGILLSQWGPNAQFTVSDINKDGSVNGADLGILLSFWGACP